MTKQFRQIRGIAEGTSYSIIYEGERDLQTEIDMLLANFEKSLSVYDPNSIISKINRNEIIDTDLYFEPVFNKAKEISTITGGAFDISAEPLFRAWGFSSEKKNPPSSEEINTFRKYIGMEKVHLEGKRVLKKYPKIVLNMNAIAKGYSADIVSEYLENESCVNYLIEIGGEIRVQGHNQDGDIWSIGIDRPSETNLFPGQEELQLILKITDRGIATSGNYRQYYILDGKKITHTIDPITGYPARHNLLSTTVLANDTLTADAFATAFMVAGMEKASEWIEKYSDLDAIFICDEEGEYKIYHTSMIEDRLVMV